MNEQPKFKIGQQFKSTGKHPQICTIIDIYKTFNFKGELVVMKYVASSELAGQTLTNYEVPEATIVRGLIN